LVVLLSSRHRMPSASSSSSSSAMVVVVVAMVRPGAATPRVRLPAATSSDTDVPRRCDRLLLLLGLMSGGASCCRRPRRRGQQAAVAVPVHVASPSAIQSRRRVTVAVHRRGLCSIYGPGSNHLLFHHTAYVL
jgi:hypothetical protein